MSCGVCTLYKCRSFTVIVRPMPLAHRCSINFYARCKKCRGFPFADGWHTKKAHRIKMCCLAIPGEKWDRFPSPLLLSTSKKKNCFQGCFLFPLINIAHPIFEQCYKLRYYSNTQEALNQFPFSSSHIRETTDLVPSIGDWQRLLTSYA